ncbi:MAG TPA: hypothetical protein VJ742_11390 [Nitrososphaera sp.]|nr:hypothetical protein [Nitrososphaera sp.]
MAKRKASKAITIGGLAALAAVVVVMILLFAADRRNSDAERSIDAIAVDAIALTGEYQEEEGKWVKKLYDNNTMIAVIEQYDPRYQALIEQASQLDVPERYRLPQDLLIKAVESEKQSNLHLRNHLVSGSPEEYEKSVDLFSLSLQYSADYDAAMKTAG